jgi:hypothetical protein
MEKLFKEKKDLFAGVGLFCLGAIIVVLIFIQILFGVYKDSLWIATLFIFGGITILISGYRKIVEYKKRQKK